MNAESEMAGADGLGAQRRGPITMQDQMGEAGGNAANLDPCAQIAESVGYSDGGSELDGTGGTDALIDYKNALKDALRRASDAAQAAERIAAQVPRKDEWRSAASFMEFVTAVLDMYGVERPERYPED